MAGRSPQINCTLLVFILTLLITNPLWADDTEIFFSRASSEDTQPNVLFVLDASNSMLRYDCADGSSSGNKCNDNSPNGSSTRLDRLKDSLKSVLINTNNINVGLMRFSTHDGGAAVLYPIRSIDQQFCNGQPCGIDSGFTTLSRPEQSTDDAVQLQSGEVIYDQSTLALLDNTNTGKKNSWIGLRFPDLFIPQGATIIDARLQLTSTADNVSNTNLKIEIQNTHDAKPFTDSDLDISGRSRALDSVRWNNLPEWRTDNAYNSPNLASLIQLIVRKPNWCGGNALGLSISGDGERLAAAFDKGSSESPILKVSYKLNNIPDSGGCIKSTVLSQLSDTIDDGNEKTGPRSGKYVVNSSDQHNIVAKTSHWRNKGYDSAVRFRNLRIPQGSRILNASITMTAKDHSWYNSYPDILIYAEDNANPSVIYNRKSNISNRRLTSEIRWSEINPTHNTESSTPSITPIVQYLVDKPNWENGNSMLFVFKAAAYGGRTFYSYDANPSRAPQLKIEFETNIRTAEENVIGPVSSVRRELISEMESIVTTWGTPTVGALIEAQRYYSGGEVHYGKQRDGNVYHEKVNPQYSRVSIPESYTGGTVIRNPHCNANTLDSNFCASEKIVGDAKYVSPLQHECQSNHIVLLTDGLPTGEKSARTAIETLLGKTCEIDGGGACGAEFAKYMASNDQFATTPGDQFITTHTIGFNFTTQWLKDVAKDGGGGYYTADTASQLSTALENIIESVQDEGSTFVAPGATVDNFSKISHRSDIYLALFQPMTTSGWNGNLKRYDFAGNPAILLDANGDPALNLDTGVFYPSARSIWSTTPDGNNIAQGGAASRLQSISARKVYTYKGLNANLSHQSNEFSTDNDLITTTDLGLNPADTALRDDMINWTLGYDTKDVDNDHNINESRYHVGDPLHSQPVIITYSGTSGDPDSVIYFGTNDGFLHAISTDDGDEVFSFIPQELIPNLNPLYESHPSHDKVYGLDGPLSLWTEDKDFNGNIDDGDHVYLYVGMRRGGKNYYSLDITDKDAPTFKWTISNTTSGFSELGETWSQAAVTKINYLGTETKVLIFGGGYDSAQDDHVTRTPDVLGRAIYIVNADTGSLIWSGGPSGGSETKSFADMTYSFPSTPKTVDTDSNGTADQIYVGDMGGRIWRFDIDEDATDINNMVHGGIVADLGTDGVISDARRFYHSPDISVSSRLGIKNINIAVGTGYQAHPLDTAIEDRFYLIRYPFDPIIDDDGKYHYGTQGTTISSTDTVEPSGVYTAITETDLFNATSNILGEGSDTEVAAAEQELAASDGWFVEMERDGEKVLGSSITFDNKILFSSYVPGGVLAACAPEIGFGIFWALNLWDATPVTGLADGDDDDLKKSDRNKPIPGGGIPAPVQTLFIETGNKNDDGEEEDKELQILAISGANNLMQLNRQDLIQRVYWSEYPNF